MRIVFDLQALQTGSAQRGIGRYASNLCFAMLSESRGHEFFLLFNSRHVEQTLSKPNIQKLIAAVGPDHVIVVPAPDDIDESHDGAHPLLEASKAIREIMIEAIRPDTVVLPSLFEYKAVLTLPAKSQRSYHTAVVVHDFIPLTDIDAYMPAASNKVWYYSKLDSLLNSDLILCNSMHTRDDTIRRFSFSPLDCINILGGCDLHLQFPEPADPLLDLAAGKFVLYCATYDPRKNVAALISAYGKLSRTMRDSMPLVLGGFMYQAEREIIDKEIAKAQLPDTQVRILGFVEDSVLAWLYKNCRVFVFPSLNEGLGLPPMEAMSFGAPVIVSNRTSLPEVVSSDDQVFESDSKDNLVKLLERVVQDDDLADKFSAHGLKRSRDFSWRRSADLALDALELATSGRSDTPPEQVTDAALFNHITSLYPNESGPDALLPAAQLLARASKELQRLQKAGAITDFPAELLPPA